MKLLRASEHKVMPWKNGGGTTTEIAVFPHAASLDAFDWRVSMATVASDGPFSLFAGVDRTLAVLDGAGMTLEIAGRDAVTLDRAAAPLAFAADAACHARLVAGQIVDLNVMSRRGRYQHAVSRIDVDGQASWTATTSTLLLLARTPVVLRSAEHAFALAHNDVVHVDARGATPFLFEAEGRAEVFAISLRRSS